MNISASSLSLRNNGQELITNIYITIMLLVFPLFVGFHGYEKTTVSKFTFFVCATLIWLAALVLLGIFNRSGLPALKLHHYLALAFMAIVCISALLSPYRSRTILGAGRYDGLATQLLYAAIFVCVSLFGKPHPCHFAALGISVSLCCVVAVFQLFDVNILGLFPGDYSYYDKGIRYSGEFLGTMGNTNVLSEFLCIAIPLFFILPILDSGHKRLWSLVPLLLSVFVMIRAGVSGGLVALAGCALIGAPIVITDSFRLRRSLLMLALCLLSACAALAFVPEYTDRSFSFSFSFDKLCLLCLAAALALALLSLPLRRVHIDEKMLRRLLCSASVFIILCGLAAVYFLPLPGSTLKELSLLLHGKIDDSFGSSRILIWRECLASWLSSPVFGHGPDTVSLTVDIDFSRYVEETGKTLRSSVDNAHNIYLGYLINTGLAGLAAYMSILICAFVRWLKNLREPFGCALGLSLLCSAFQGFFALGLCLTAPLFWITLALLFACGRKHDDLPSGHFDNKHIPNGGNHE